MRLATVLSCSLLLTSAGATPQEVADQPAAEAKTGGGACCSESKTAAAVSLDGKLARIFGDGQCCESAATGQTQPEAGLAVKVSNAQGRSKDDESVEATEILAALGYINASGDERGYMGVYMEVSDGAMVVNSVMSGAPAEQAGLKAGDRVLKIEGHAVKSMEDLNSFLQTLEAGNEIQLVIDRGGEERKISLTLVPRETLETDVEPEIEIEELISMLEDEAVPDGHDEDEVSHGFFSRGADSDEVKGFLARIHTRSDGSGENSIRIVIDGKVIDLGDLAEFDLSGGSRVIEIEVETDGSGGHTVHTRGGKTIEIHTGHGDSGAIVIDVDGALDDESMSELRARIRNRVKREVRLHRDGDSDHDVFFTSEGHNLFKVEGKSGAGGIWVQKGDGENVLFFGGGGEHGVVHDFTFEGEPGIRLRRRAARDGHDMIFGIRHDDDDDDHHAHGDHDGDDHHADDDHDGDDDDHDVRIFRIGGPHGRVEIHGLEGLRGLEGLHDLFLGLDLKGLEGLEGLGDEIRELIHEHLGDLHLIEESDGHDRARRRVRVEREVERHARDGAEDGEHRRESVARDEIDALRAEIRELRNVIEDLRAERADHGRSRPDRRELDEVRREIRALLESLEGGDR